MLDEGLVPFADKSIGMMLGLSLVHGPSLDQLLEPLSQSHQLTLHFGNRRRRRGLITLPIIGEHRGIDGIGLGPLALGLSGRAHLSRIDDGNGDVGFVQALDQGLFVAPGGFANDMSVGDLLELLLQPGAIGRRIGQFDLSATQMDLEGGFSDVNSDINGLFIYVHI